jgi:D-sedoheptulose 7-phosphate isomerase
VSESREKFLDSPEINYSNQSKRTFVILQLKNNLRESTELQNGYLTSELPHIVQLASEIHRAMNSGNKILICGNGGSAADAQHFAAELTGRYLKERGAYPALALTTDTSALTAIGNDYGFEVIFSRQIEGLGKSGDILIAISTSGQSANIIKAVEASKACGIRTIGLLGRDGGALKNLVDDAFIVPSQVTARIQEIHEMILHFLCESMDALS